MTSHEELSVGNLQDFIDACDQHVAQADTLTVEGAATRLHSEIANYARCVAANTIHADQSSEKADEAAAISVMVHMQRFSLVCCATCAPVINTKDAVDNDTLTCIGDWETWLLGLESQSIALASKVAVFLPSLQESWRGDYVVGGAGSPQIYRIDEIIGAFFSRWARRCVEEWTTYGTPLRTLLPPLELLTTFARFRWAWGRFMELRHAVSEGYSGEADACESVAESTEEGVREQKREGAGFLDITCEVEKCHADKVAREVLLYSFKAIDWEGSSVVPSVKGVAPLVWCLFLRCRSYALRAHSQNRISSDFFAYEASARLIAELLRCTVDGVCVFLNRQAPVMHEIRAKQLCTCDIPCLVLLTRLLFSWIALASDAETLLLPSLDHSLRHLVSLAIQLYSVSVRQIHSPSTISHLKEDRSEASRTLEETLFIEVACKTPPLSVSEILSDTTAVPWAAEFARASEVQVILDKRTVVAPIP
ncbi:hypothetical protein JKF63_01895 [Porcisia hertigi]|uniref:Uncharacterized protein n=1 Tax=Porcisia hertigi TaxID=2761500 RepID=A0A836L0I1_9TRYP|nr:hypothetical protein JKF63_01895 [Porcisia hertigi]